MRLQESSLLDKKVDSAAMCLCPLTLYLSSCLECRHEADGAVVSCSGCCQCSAYDPDAHHSYIQHSLSS